VLAGCANIDMYAEEGGEMPTGDVVLMTLTNLATGETDPWGVKIYKAAMKVVETESEYGYYYEEYVIDPDSPVTAAFCTIEELVNSKNADMDLWYTHNKNVTRVEPVYVEELYDENWNPTGEYVVYEVYKEVRYAEESDLEVEEWGDETYYYYCDEDGNYWNVYQDENGKFYYNFEEVLEIPAKERGYTVVSNDSWGSYAVDKDGNVVMDSEEYVQEGSDPMITTWDTLKYYGDIYNPKFWQAFTSTVSFSGEYAVADMKAEDYPYLSAEEFDSLMKKCMDVMDITLDEEVLAIRASIPESWGYLYEDYFQKNGYISKSNYIEETDNYEVVKVIFDRKEKWYINNGYKCEVAVRNDDITTEMPVHLAGYSFSYAVVEGGDAAKKSLAEMLEYKTEKDILSSDVNGMPVYYVEEQYWGDERFIYVLQDIGLENYISILITTCDMEIKTEELVKQFLLDGNYSVEQSVLQLDEE